MAEQPFTLTIRKNLTTGRPIIFRGWRAQRLAGDVLGCTIALNRSIAEEKKPVLAALSGIVKDGGELVSGLPGADEGAKGRYEQGIVSFKVAAHRMHMKLKCAEAGAAKLPEGAARQLILDEHLPTSISLFASLASRLLCAVLANEKKTAETAHRLLKIGAGRIERLSALLDSLSEGSIWEIKALAEHACTRAALHLAGAGNGPGAKKAEGLRASAACFERLARKLNTVEGAGLVPLLVEIAMACEDMAKLAQNGARYSKELREKIEAIRRAIEPERQEVANLPEDDPRRTAFNVFEHHLANSTMSVITVLFMAAKKPEKAASIAAAGSKNALGFLQIAMRVRESDDLRALALVFTSGDTGKYLEALEGKYIA